MAKEQEENEMTEAVKEEEKREERIRLLLEDVASLEDYARDVFDFSPLPIAFVSPLNVFLEVNSSFEKITGYEPQELVGVSTEKIFENVDASEIRTEVLERKSIERKEVFIMRKDESKMPVRVFAKTQYNKDGEAVGYFLGLFDLSEVHDTEQELRDAQTALLNILEDTDEARKRAERERAKTQAIIANFSDGLIVLDKEEDVSLLNPKAEEMFGVKGEEFEGQSFEGVPKESGLAPLVKLAGERLEESFSREELTLSEELIVEVSNVVMEEESDLGNLLIVHDITRKKTVERLKTEFVSLAAHQLRTPLSAIKWSLNMLLEGDAGKIKKDQRELIEKTYTSNERMITLVNSLLSVTRIEEGRFVYEKTPIDLVEIVEDAVSRNRSALKDKEVEISFHKPEKELPKVNVDKEKISIAVNNFVDNAAKYTLEGGRVDVYLERKEEEGEIEFRVEDTGVGIPEKQQKRVFEKFFRGANVTRLETVGSGLGLFITKNIIEAHEGKIGFDSKEGEGSTFWFRLPIKEEFRKFVEGF